MRSWLMLAVVGLSLPTLVTWIYFDLLASSPPAIQQSAYAIGKAVQFALPIAAWWLVARRAQPQHTAESDWASETAKPTRFRYSLLWGVGTGLAIALTALGTYNWLLIPSGLADGAMGAAREKIATMGLKSPAIFLAVALFYSLCHSGLEEYYWRWFVFRHLNQRRGLAWSVVLSSLGFMAHHVLVLARYFGWTSPLTYGLAMCVATGGVIWAVLYRRFGTVLGPWVSHALVDAAIFVIAWQMIDWS